MRLQVYILILIAIAMLGSHFSMASVVTLQQQDTARQDTLGPYEPSQLPTFQPSYRFGDPFSNRSSRSPLFLSDPSQVDLQVQFNPDTTAEDAGISYSVYENIGNLDFRPASTMTFREFNEYSNAQLNKEYFKERSAGLDGESAVSGRSLIPRLYISPVFDRIFGGSYVDIQPNGFVNLDFGGRFQRIDNPAIPRRQQRNGGFNFDQQISMNVVGKVGEKLAITANFDNNNTFDFQNNLKVDYTGYEEDIIKKIEIGNVSMPVTNSLMSGAQSLFGVKTELQFGKMWVTAVASQQRGRSETLTIESGFQGREFDIQSSQYDENRHFFLGHFFRDNYAQWLETVPQITSGVNITRVEVYVLNRNNDTRTTRNIVAFQDLGEGRVIGNEGTTPLPNPPAGNPARNEANTLFNNLPPRTTKVSDLPVQLDDLGLASGSDYVLITTARRLDETEYTINAELGYVTLQRRLQSDEILAVSYQYTYNGVVYQVGEIQTDYSERADDEALYLKMLRPNQIAIEQPTWDLMMKNIYNLNAAQVSREGFQLRVIYRDDATGQDNPSLHEGQNLKDRPLIEVMGLDQLNPNNDRQPDANFDFIEGITIDTRNGNVIFPVLEPFGSHLETFFDPQTEGDLIKKFVYDELYSNTKAIAERDATRDKFVILGRLTAGSASEIALPGINIAEGSVVVTAGGTLLTEGLDYNVDYNLGIVRILNDGILNSGKQINVSYEKADLFNFQTRTLTGARFDYRFNDNFNLGATVLHLNERPGGISRFAVGSEPTRNTKYGFDINFQQDSRLLTKIVDALPFVNTKEPSNVTFNAEFAQMIPGTSNVVNGKGTSYIDDFENAVTPINIGGWQSWKLASTPSTFPEGSSRGLDVNDRRAKLAWYTVDRSIFYQSQGNIRPDNISEDDLQNHYERPVLPQEIFPQRDNNQIVVNEPLLDIAYFPSERGQYNYNPATTNVDDPRAEQGLLDNPEQNWGGVTRAITNEVNFTQTNIQYLEFWLLDPFIEGENGIVKDGLFNTNASEDTDGGRLIFHLGSISEDVAPDSQFAFENGLPEDGTPIPLSTWGQVPIVPYLTNFFANTPGARDNQDVGLDGLADDRENEILDFNAIGQANLGSDPSGDNFRYILDGLYDELDAKIVQRYKNWNGVDGNSPISDDGNANFIPASTTLPDKEDINNDNTISDLEEYFEYQVPLVPGEFAAGRGFITQQVGDNTSPENPVWYLFRIPIQDVGRPVGTPTFENIKYIRMYLTGFSRPVVLRMAQMRLVGSQWIKSERSLREQGLNEIPNTTTSDFQVSVVNIEENSTGNGGPPYVLPPGIERDIDNTTTVNRRFNEQSLQVCVDELDDGDARAVFKNVNYDLVNYGKMQMFFHAHSFMGDDVQDDEVTGFIRLGTDEDENYYEIEVPLKITPDSVSAISPRARETVWPSENNIDVSIKELIGIKSERNRARLPIDFPYRSPSNDGRYTFTIKGNPDISAVKILMIGVRNPALTAENIEDDDGLAKSVCIWSNELRVTDFDNNAGWAANARLSTKLADLGTVSASTRYTSIGFGTIQQRISERTRAETKQYDISTNLNLEKFFRPDKTGLVIPMFASYEQSVVTPQFDPLDPDVPLEASLETFDTDEERDEYKRFVEDRTTRRSINFTNVRKQKVNPESPSRVYDIENLAFSYAFSDQRRSNSTTQSFVNKTVSGGVSYNFSPSVLSIEPLKNSESLSSPYFALLKDFNFSPIPSNFSVSFNLRRDFRATQFYNNELTTEGVEPVFERLFTFIRNYSFRWDLSKSLGFSYNAVANAVIDEPEEFIEGDISTRAEREFIWDQILSFGRMRNFNQNIAANYKLPLDKLPFTDWISSDIRYSVGYSWIAGSIIQPDGSGIDTTEVAEELFFGNFINNQRDIGLNARFDLSKLYDKATFLKNANTPKPPGEKGSFGRSFLRLVTMLKSVNGAYSIQESTELAGYNRNASFFGFDEDFDAPGIGFILGSQDPNIRFKAAEKGWLITNENLNSPFRQSRRSNFDFRADLEPAGDLKIQFTVNRSITDSYQEIFRFDAQEGGFRSLTPARSGGFTSTFLSISTAFEPQPDDNFSKAFASFQENIFTVRDRLNETNPSGTYDTLSQDVLIPAFVAAYSGQSANDVGLTPFPRTPLPNWRLDYTGLSKIPALREVFSSITISHGYNSTYSVSGFNNRVFDENILSLQNSLLDYPLAQPDSTGRLLPVYVINQVLISEQFVPLIGINIRTTDNISTRIEFRKSRNLALNMANAQVTETNNNDFTFDFGYTKTGFKLPFKFQGRTATLENDLTIRMAASVRDTRTIQRKVEGEDVITNGNRTFQMRPTITYRLNKQLDLTMYFERNVTDPKVLSSFKRATSTFGVQLRFGLAQ